MTTRTLLHGLNEEDSAAAVWNLLFSPQLRNHFGSGWSREWTYKLIENASGDQTTFSKQYNSLSDEVRAVLSACPRYSMANPPWSMASLDMRFGLIPWITPEFDRPLAMLLSEGSALEKHFGEIVPFAFFLRGGPGDSKQTAFHVCAPASTARAAAGDWLMHAYLRRRGEGFRRGFSTVCTRIDESSRLEVFQRHGEVDQSQLIQQPSLRRSKSRSTSIF